MSIPFRRLFCSYLCPVGGLQECAFAVNEKKPKQGWRNYIKFAIWCIWLTIVSMCYFHSGKIFTINFFFETENGISVSSVQSYIIYYGITCLIFIPSILFGKRVFCHYLCWMAPFMILGIKLRRILHLPGIHIKADEKGKCISCGKCNHVCPIGIDVMGEIKHEKIINQECIQCRACIDNCPKNVLDFGVVERKDDRNGK